MSHGFDHKIFTASYHRANTRSSEYWRMMLEVAEKLRMNLEASRVTLHWTMDIYQGCSSLRYVPFTCPADRILSAVRGYASTGKNLDAYGKTL